jgi:hypothetical protein
MAKGTVEVGGGILDISYPIVLTTLHSYDRTREIQEVHGGQDQEGQANHEDQEETVEARPAADEVVSLGGLMVSQQREGLFNPMGQAMTAGLVPGLRKGLREGRQPRTVSVLLWIAPFKHLRTNELNQPRQATSQ